MSGMQVSIGGYMCFLHSESRLLLPAGEFIILLNGQKDLGADCTFLSWFVGSKIQLIRFVGLSARHSGADKGEKGENEILDDFAVNFLTGWDIEIEISSYPYRIRRRCFSWGFVSRQIDNSGEGIRVTMAEIWGGCCGCWWSRACW